MHSSWRVRVPLFLSDVWGSCSGKRRQQLCRYFAVSIVRILANETRNARTHHNLKFATCHITLEDQLIRSWLHCDIWGAPPTSTLYLEVPLYKFVITISITLSIYYYYVYGFFVFRDVK